MGQKIREQPGKPLQQRWIVSEQQAAQKDVAEAESEGAQHDQHGDLRGAQTLRRISAVAHHRAREHARPDIVRQRVGREGAQRNEKPGDMGDAQMQERDPVVPGERRIGEQRRGGGGEIIAPANGLEMGPDLRADRFALELVIEQIERHDDRQKADKRPEILENFLHAAYRAWDEDRSLERPQAGHGFFPRTLAGRSQAPRGAVANAALGHRLCVGRG